MSGNDKFPRVNILGVGINAINIENALLVIDHWISSDQANFVCVTGVHGVMESQRSTAIRKIHNSAGMVTPDGMPLVWLSRLNGYPDAERVYGPDLMVAVCSHSIEKGYRHFFYGGTDWLVDHLVQRMTKRFQGLQVAGTYSQPFGPLSLEEDRKIVSLINDADPDIIWVGLSTPKQEIWMSEHIGQLGDCVLIGVGAAFDFLAGTKKQAPAWMQRIGLEWFFRLCTEPKRLWKRYLINNPYFVILVISQATGLRKYSLDYP